MFFVFLEEEEEETKTNSPVFQSMQLKRDTISKKTGKDVRMRGEEGEEGWMTL